MNCANLRKCINASGLKQREIIGNLPNGWTPSKLNTYLSKYIKWRYISLQEVEELAKALGVEIHITDKPIKLI